ncbi:MAG: hypothetical protein AB1451_15735 [Nitrospirota bacterium]
MSWVNVIDSSAIASLLGLPEGIVLVGYLTVGHVARFTENPASETFGGEARCSVESVLFYDHWGNRSPRPNSFQQALAPAAIDFREGQLYT